MDGLARELRLAPQLVRGIGFRLVQCGLLVDAGDEAPVALARNPQRIGVAEVIDAVVRDPALESARRARVAQHLSARLIASRQVPGAGQTLGELAGLSGQAPSVVADATSTIH